MKVFVYHCWRDKPVECRHKWESKIELPQNTVRCPKCGIHGRIGMTVEDRKPQNEESQTTS